MVKLGRFLWVFFLFFAVQIGFADTPAATQFNFEKDGEVLKKVALTSLYANKTLETLEVLEPQEKKLVSFKGVPMQDVLVAGFGDSWTQATAIGFICADGYRATVPVKKFEKAKALLAVERVGQAFTVVKEGKTVALAPYYLIWDNKANEAIKSAGAGIWPYQVLGLELISAKK